MSIPTTRRSAKALVEKISNDHGYLSEAVLATITPDTRRLVEEALLKKDLMIGSSVITLAKNLYTSKARFVFELLQNADDNDYSKSTSPPYVAFRMYSNRIVLECNENGFNDQNLRAICSVGNSSKTGNQGYIGEKGIGFKSVFMAAWKVHIQSGAFSFSFTHRKGDSGLGMISPQWEDVSDGVPLSPLTIITLYLNDTGNKDDLAKVRQNIETQFQELQEAILLFMKNLKKIHIKFYDEDEKMVKSTTFSKSQPSSLLAILTKTTIANGNTNKEVKYFHVTTHEVTNLSKNDNRTYSEKEEATRAYSRSTVTLAFPLTADSIPLISPQELFVFLPLRRIGFNFLIQADFVTDASRQDIVIDSRRNLDLLDGIADTFNKAILQFVEHEQSSLRYQWMRYLPDKKAPNVGSLWVFLIEKIASRLSGTPVLYGRKGVRRHRIATLCRPTPLVLDEHGELLLDDGDPGQVISKSYAESDVDILVNYGLKRVTHRETVAWLKRDLAQGSQSRMRSPETSDDWHTRFAILFSRPFWKKYVGAMEKLRALELLPLQNGTWMSASSGPVYFTQCQDIDIPNDLNLNIISKNITNKDRLVLFKYLGVEKASISFIRTLIKKKYYTGDAVSAIDLDASKRHLEFLYLTDHLRSDTEPPYAFLRIYDSTKNLVCPLYDDIYIANNEPYGHWELFRPTEPGPNPGDGAPGFFSQPRANQEYFKDEIDTPQGQKLTWVEWFYDQLELEKDLDIFCGAELSDVELYLQKHRPEKFLGCLCRHAGYLSPGSDLGKILWETEVLCRGGRQFKLNATYFPTQDLEKRVERFVEPGASFPWLWLDLESTPDGIPTEWKSLLTVLGCGIPATGLDFALDMLNYSLDALSDNISLSSRSRLFGLYEHIQTKFRESENRQEAQQKILEYFAKKRCIYIPLGENNCSWAFPRECVWNAPQELRSKHALKYLYEPILATDSANLSYFKQFFSATLKIADSTWKTYLQELRALKADDCDDTDIISGIYKALDVLRPKLIALTKDEVIAAFEDDALIYLETDDGPAWHKTSECVWSRAAALRGRVSLNEEYEDLEKLFVDFLGVKPVDLAMAIDELKEAGKDQSTTVDNLVESLWTVNSLLSSTSEHPQPKNISKSRIFPIRYPDGRVTCTSEATDFCVVDREGLYHSFKTEIKFLNFTLKEVAELRPFIEWIGLEGRYLSRNVENVTTFPGGSTRQTSNPKHQIKTRAHALLRIAAHYGSPRLQTQQALRSFYEILRNSEVLETDSISSTLVVYQDGEPFEEKGEDATLHIEETQEKLKIYLPSDADDQEYIFSTILAGRLFSQMMTNPLTNIPGYISKDGINATKDILLTPRSKLARALVDCGIATISIENVDEDEPPEATVASIPIRSREASSQVLLRTSRAESQSSTFPTPASTEADVNWDDEDFGHEDGYENGYYLSSTVRSNFRSSGPSPSPSLFPRPVSPGSFETNTRHYGTLLQKVVEAARISSIPHFQPNSQDTVFITRDTSDWGLRSLSQLERDCKVGAAGELYVFELLSHMSTTRPLPGFSRDNWQSTIRKYARVHPEYTTMEPWNGRETSDITYTDSEGILTAHLIEKGYLSQETWADKRPKYFIEVKTTTIHMETQFFMSKSQYQRMRDNILDGENTHTIYVIFRVYNLGRDNMGLKIYLDPATLSDSGALQFTAEGWSAVPGRNI